jgi:hypothetical protein
MARGERIDPECHRTRADVKAVTLHLFSLQKIPSGWQARGIQDICHPGQECIIGLMIVFVTDEIRKGFERSRSRGRSTSRAMSRQWRENAVDHAALPRSSLRDTTALLHAAGQANSFL